MSYLIGDYELLNSSVSHSNYSKLMVTNRRDIHTAYIK